MAQFGQVWKSCSLIRVSYAIWFSWERHTSKIVPETMSSFVPHKKKSPPARWGLLDFITVVLLLLLLSLHLLLLLLLPLPQLLLHQLCIHFHVHFRLANSSPRSSPTSARSGHYWTSTARVWAYWAPLGLNLGPSELSEHFCTSTWDRPSSVSTAGPQPGTLRAQWTWDPPSSVSTAGPQRPDRMPEDMPDRTPDRMSERMPEDMPDKVPECLPHRMPEDMPDRTPDRMSEDMPGDMPDRMPDGMPEALPDRMPENMPEDMPDRYARRYAR